MPANLITADAPVMRAMALLWTFRPIAAIANLLGHLRYKRADGRPYTQNDVRTQVNAMRTRGEVETHGGGDGLHRLVDPLRARVYRDLLDDVPATTLHDALYANERLTAQNRYVYWGSHDTAAVVGIMRLALFSGTPAAKLRTLADDISRSQPWHAVIGEAALAGFDPELFERIDPIWRWDLYHLAAQNVAQHWQSGLMPLVDHVATLLDARRAEMPLFLQLQLAEIFLLQGQTERSRALLDQLPDAAATALRACLHIQAGQWGAGQTQFEAALKQRQVELKAKKQLFPPSMAWLYPLALLAQGTPEHLQRAEKFCLGEAGKRKPDPYDPWGLWAHAIGVRLGKEVLEKAAIGPAFAGTRPDFASLWRLLLAAWLGRKSQPAAAKGPNLTDYRPMIEALRLRLRACRLAWLEAQLDGAAALLHEQSPPEVFFMAAPTESWRDVLAVLCNLESGADLAKATHKTRLIWVLKLDRHGGPERIDALEQKMGTRGWNTPRPISFGKVIGNTELPPWDAKVASAISQDRFYASRYNIDRAAAIMALIGHPAVSLAEAPEQLVELIEGRPEVEVVKQRERFVMKITPPLRAALSREELPYVPSDERREYEALRAITVVQDAPQRLRVIRLSAAQRKAAELLAQGFAVPAQGRAELDKTLQALAAHFQVQADHAEAAREVPAETRLRAELSPNGDALVLRLVAAPLGAAGPRLVPAQGRERVMALQEQETVGTRRDLAAERRQLDAVLAALPMLDELAGGEFCEWLLGDADAALGMIEQLPQISAISAIDWPKGKPVRVYTVDAAHIAINVKSERDWFRVSGSANVDEGLVMQLADLVAAAQSKSRFVPMGDGVYAALTRSLKQRLMEMAALAETDRKGDMRLPSLAGGWLDDAIDGMTAKTDKEFRQSIERLQTAQNITPVLPASLQAELRPYQEDGYVWAMRLAQAGLGGCLADDMGLGKTLQALGVLLARAAGGPALVLAPTSVCGNWLAETQRFAPTLDMHIYGEAERDTLLAEATAGQVVVASYTLFQQAQERFAAVRWHTVIADEAQAIKNANAKRSQAVFELDADFRLALSGTPVENRLAELWSIMRFAAPGLLGTQSRFAERFANPIERNRDRDAQHLLRRLIAPFILRRTKGQVLQELPARTELIYSVAPDAVEAAHYEALRRSAVAVASQAIDSAPGQAKLNILAQLTRLRRGACDPRLPTPDYPAAGAKVQAFAQLATELSSNGHKTLVFSQFVDFLTLLKAPLDEAGIRYQYLDGATPAAERTRRVAAFQAGEGDLFLISLKAGGFGLNLTAADYVVITDPWWNPAAEDQAMGRAHRIGQLRPVTVYRMVTKGTVEERIVELHHDKRALADSVLAEGEVTALPSTDDLMALIRGE